MNSDFRDLLSALSAAGAKYLVVGAQAFGIHALPRATGDLDIWVSADRENAQRVWRALRDFGAPMGDLPVADLQRPKLVFQIGVAPVRVDVMTSLDGLEFEQCWPRRTSATYEGLDIPVIGLDDLIVNKRTTGRPQDLVDVELLERIRSHRPKAP